MKPKHPLIVYDHDAYRLIPQNFQPLYQDDRSSVFSGFLFTGTKANQKKVLRVAYSLKFLSDAKAAITLSWLNPFSEVASESSSQIIEAGKFGDHWHFACPIKKRCRFTSYLRSIWIGKLNEWACQECGFVRRYAKQIEDRIITFRKDPSLIKKVLERPFEREMRKKLALIALRKLSRKFAKMTDSYETLSGEQKIYYGKLRRLLFDTGGRKPFCYSGPLGISFIKDDDLALLPKRKRIIAFKRTS